MRARAVLRGLAGAARIEPSRGIALRRRHGGGAGRDRPALDPGAAAGFDRPGSVRQCRRAVAGARGFADSAGRIYLRPPCGRNLRARRRAAAPRRDGRRRSQRRPPRRRRAAGRPGREDGGNLIQSFRGRLVEANPESRDSGFDAAASPRNDGGIGGFRLVPAIHVFNKTARNKGIRMRLPREIGPIHFVGIGGIGMSGIAEVLCNLGYTVQGSDAADGANVARLREKGITVSIGHKAENVDGADVVVVSTAIKRDNPELVAARAQRIPVVRRAEMLAELMRLKSCVAIAGTHGKTTTTTMVAALLDAGDLDPTVINGGIINAYGTNARLGAGDWMVVEADESDGTFLKLPADVAVVTNVDPEHLDHFKTFEAVQDAFRSFVENVPFYGFAVMCTDHPVVQTLVGKIEDRRIVTYGENPQADARLVDLTPMGGGSKFKVVFRNRK